MSVMIPRRDRRSPLVSLAALTVITVVSLAVRGPAWSTGRQPQVKPAQERIGAFGVERFAQPLFDPNSDELKASREIRVEIGRKVRTFTVDALRALPRVTLPNHEVIGVKRGPLGRFTWAGASLKDVLLSVEPRLSEPARAGVTITVISTDGWTATFGWAELFGTVPRGEGLYLAKGCNECHGRRAEGTAPGGKRPAPRLAGRIGPSAETAALVRDPARHAGITAYTSGLGVPSGARGVGS